MSLPCLVWTDLRSDTQKPSPVGELRAHVRLQHLVGTSALLQGIERSAPTLACFEYDYPSLSGLKALRATKLAYPSLPILMLTVQHSEALAVWAFRTRVWDYLVKPVSAGELWRRIRLLLPLLAAAQGGARQVAMPAPLIPPEARLGAPGADERMTEALTYLQRHFGEVLRLRDVARSCRMGDYEFSRCFKRVHGQTFRDYLCQYRLECALEMLGNPRVSVCEVANAAGFRNASHFSRLFRQRLGISPTQYRARLREGRIPAEDA